MYYLNICFIVIVRYFILYLSYAVKYKKSIFVREETILLALITFCLFSKAEKLIVAYKIS